MDNEIQKTINKINNLKLENYGDDILSAIKNKFSEMYWEIVTLDEIMTQIRESRAYEEDFSADGYECLDYYRSLPVSLMQYIEDCELESISYFKDVKSCYKTGTGKTKDVLKEVKENLISQEQS